MIRSIWRARLYLATTGGACATLDWAWSSSSTQAESTKSSNDYKYLVAGCGTAAHVACEVLTNQDPSASLLIVAPWWNGNIPNGGTFAAGNKLVTLNTRNRTATLSGGSIVSFERALIAVGGDTPLPPVDSVVTNEAIKKVTGCRSAIEHAKILHVLNNVISPNRAHFTVVGGGWIALSAGVELLARGADVTFLYNEPALLARHLPKYLSNELRRRLRYLSDGGADFLAYAAIRHVAMINNELIVHAGVVFDPMADVMFKSDHVIMAPTYPSINKIKSDELEENDDGNGGFVTNRELSIASDVYAAGVCAVHPKANNVRWSELYALQSGIHAAKNMMGERNVFDVPKYSIVRLQALKTKCTIVGNANGDCETLGYFNVPKLINEVTCGGMLMDGVVFYLEPQRSSRGGCTFGIVGAVLWDGVCSDEHVEIENEEIVKDLLNLIDAEARVRNVVENQLDEFAKKWMLISRDLSQRRQDVGRVLWRRHVAARNVALPKDEQLWMDNTSLG